jgi:hypothetical protein
MPQTRPTDISARGAAFLRLKTDPNQWNATESSRFGLPLDPVAFQVETLMPVAAPDQTGPFRGATELRRDQPNE